MTRGHLTYTKISTTLTDVTNSDASRTLIPTEVGQ